MNYYAIARPTPGSRMGFVVREPDSTDSRDIVSPRPMDCYGRLIKGLREIVDEPFGQRRPFWAIASGNYEFFFLGYLEHTRAAMELVKQTPQFISTDVVSYNDRKLLLQQYDWIATHGDPPPKNSPGSDEWLKQALNQLHRTKEDIERDFFNTRTGGKN